MRVDEVSSTAAAGSKLFVNGSQVAVDGTDTGTRAAFTGLHLGVVTAGLPDTQEYIGGIYVLNAQMSAAQRSAFNAYCQKHWGTP